MWDSRILVRLRRDNDVADPHPVLWHGSTVHAEDTAFPSTKIDFEKTTLPSPRLRVPSEPNKLCCGSNLANVNPVLGY